MKNVFVKDTCSEKEWERYLDEFKDSLSSGAVVFYFLKKDGSTRKMRATTSMIFVPADVIEKMEKNKKKKKKVSLPENLIHVWDIEKEDWRIVNINKLLV